MTRSRVQKLIAQGEIRVNGKEVRANYKLRETDHIEINIPEGVSADFSYGGNKISLATGFNAINI